jgi:hypothetical protein
MGIQTQTIDLDDFTYTFPPAPAKRFVRLKIIDP